MTASVRLILFVFGYNYIIIMLYLMNSLFKTMSINNNF